MTSVGLNVVYYEHEVDTQPVGKQLWGNESYAHCRGAPAGKEPLKQYFDKDLSASASCPDLHRHTPAAGEVDTAALK